MTPSQFRTIRERLGYTQAGLAAFLRVSDRHIRMIEAGDRKATGPICLIMELLDDGRI